VINIDTRHKSLACQVTELARTVRLAIDWMLAAVLAGCAVGPDYQVPATTLGPFHNAQQVSGQSASVAPPLDKWWVGFNDPVLNRLIERALDQNLDLAAAIARTQQARAAAQAAGAQLLPTLDATAQATALHQSLNSPLGQVAPILPGYTRDQRLYDLGGAASWEIDLAGGLRRGAQAARAEVQAAKAALAGTRITVAADVADAYFQIRGNQSRISYVQEQIEVDAHLLVLVVQLRGRGLANDRELSQAQAVLQQAQAALPPLRIALESQLNRLDVLLAAQPGTYAAELAAFRDIPDIPAIPSSDTPTNFLRRRPDIVAAERRLAASNANIGAALSEYYPKLSLSGLVGFESLNTHNLLKSASFQPSATGAIRWRIFDFGKVDAEVKQARGANAEALAQYRQTVLHAAEDVENAFVSLTQTEARTGRLQDEITSLRRSRDLSQQAFSAGAIPLTDVLDADRQLLVAQDDLALNRAAAARAAVLSFRALGGGWAPP